MPGANDDDLYKRGDDKRWRERTDERIAALTSGETVQNDRLDGQAEQLADLRELMEGVSGDKDDNGFKGDVKELWTAVNRLNSVLSLDITGNPGYDHSGNPGYLKKVEIMWKDSELSERRADRIWKGMTPIAVAIVTLVGTVFLNIEKIERIIHQITGKPEVKTVVKKKQPKRRPRAPEKRVEPTDDELPEVPRADDLPGR